jgi:hypothetical protein
VAARQAEDHPMLVACYVTLVVACVVLPYLLGVPPRSPREWRLMAITIAFLTWLLLGFVSLGPR